MKRLLLAFAVALPSTAAFVLRSAPLANVHPGGRKEERRSLLLATRGNQEDNLFDALKETLASVFDNGSNGYYGDEPTKNNMWSAQNLDWKRLVTQTPTPGVDDLPFLVPLLLVPAGGLVLPDAISIALVLVLAAAVVLEATKAPGGRNFVVDSVRQILGNPTPVIESYHYLPVGYPLVLAMGAIFLPFPTNVVLLGSFAGFWLVLGPEDKNVLALSSAIVTTGIVNVAMTPETALAKIPLMVGFAALVVASLFVTSKQQQQQRGYYQDSSYYGRESNSYQDSMYDRQIPNNRPEWGREQQGYQQQNSWQANSRMDNNINNNSMMPSPGGNWGGPNTNNNAANNLPMRPGPGLGNNNMMDNGMNEPMGSANYYEDEQQQSMWNNNSNELQSNDWNAPQNPWNEGGGDPSMPGQLPTDQMGVRKQNDSWQ